MERLRIRREFLRVAGARRKWVTPGLVLQVAARDEREPPTDDVQRPSIRYGLTVSKKVGGAVVRNRARRRLRALAEAVLPKRAAAGNDYVLIGRAATVQRPFDALVHDLETALRKLGSAKEGAR